MPACPGADGGREGPYIRYLLPTPDEVDMSLDYDVSSDDEGIVKALKKVTSKAVALKMQWDCHGAFLCLEGGLQAIPLP